MWRERVELNYKVVFCFFFFLPKENVLAFDVQLDRCGEVMEELTEMGRMIVPLMV